MVNASVGEKEPEHLGKNNRFRTSCVLRLNLIIFTVRNLYTIFTTSSNPDLSRYNLVLYAHMSQNGINHVIELLKMTSVI